MNYLTATTLRNAIATAAPQLHAQVLFDPTHGPCVAIVPPHNLTLDPTLPTTQRPLTVLIRGLDDWAALQRCLQATAAPPPTHHHGT